MLATPVILGSLAALRIARMHLEDRALRAELPGYEEYARQENVRLPRGGPSCDAGDPEDVFKNHRAAGCRRPVDRHPIRVCWKGSPFYDRGERVAALRDLVCRGETGVFREDPGENRRNVY